MGYSTQGIAVDLGRLRSAIGSRDQSILDQVRTSQREALNHAGDGDGLSLDEALRNIVMGEKTEAKWAYQYAYALELVCRTLGTPLENDDLIQFVTDLDLETGLNATRLPVDLPTPNDFPSVSFLTAEEVQREYERFHKSGVTVGDDEDLDAARGEVVNYLRQASDLNQALVLFAY